MNAFPTCFGFTRVPANQRHVISKINETFLSTLLLIFISSRYFIHNARRDTESDIVIQMILEHDLVQRFKKKQMDEKITFNKDM